MLNIFLVIYFLQLDYLCDNGKRAVTLIIFLLNSMAESEIKNAKKVSNKLDK